MSSTRQRLARINLNLLMVLDVLLQEKHVTKASEKLYVTQSTVSASLTQLREIFQDELLTRESNTMVLTPKAQSLATKMPLMLKQLEELFFSDVAFNPKAAQQTFNLAMDDCMECLLLPELHAYLSAHAPGIKITTQSIGNLTQQLFIEPNKVDLAIGGLYEPISFLRSEQLFSVHLVCVGDANNPILQKPLTLKKYLAAEHLSLYSPQHQNLDVTAVALQALGKTRNISLNVTHISTALYLLMNSALIATAPFTLIEKITAIEKDKGFINLTYQELPFKLPDLPIYQVWHAQFEHDSAHRWLRSVIKNLLKTAK